MVKPYIRDFKPVLIGVDGGADALLEAGYKPDVIVGDMDSVSDEALRRRGASRPRLSGRAWRPGEDARAQLGVAYEVVRATGTSEDVALLLAHEKGSELIVAVGTHFNLIEFLERNRAGMSSTFVTRLKVGEILVDAKGVSRLASRQVGIWPLVALHPCGPRRDRRRRSPCPGFAASDRVPRAAACATARDRLTSACREPLASRELLAARDDVWSFIAEPHHFSDWWPGIGGVQPDRRGLAEGARWEHQRHREPDAPPAADVERDAPGPRRRRSRSASRGR